MPGMLLSPVNPVNSCPQGQFNWGRETIKINKIIGSSLPMEKNKVRKENRKCHGGLKVFLNFN